MSKLSHALIATALAAGTADAGKRVVVLDFDGPRALADTGRDAVVRALGSEHDLISPRRWLDARSTASRTKRGPKMWTEAAKRAGVDALVEGWVQDDKRQQVLTIVVSSATTGEELDHVTIKLGKLGKLGKVGITDDSLRALREELDERLDGIEPAIEPPSPIDPVKLGTTTPAFGPQLPPAEPAPAPAAAPTQVGLAEVLSPKADVIAELPSKLSRPTPRVRVAGGVGWSSRSLAVNAENQDGVTQYAGVGAKQLGVDAALYPWPRQRRDGALSGVGFSFGVNQSLASTVTFDDLEEVGDYAIDQHGWNAAVHYRAPLGELFAIDGEVGYGRQTYNLDDAPPTFEVPNTSYHYLQAGTHLDLSITERASVGFGGKYFHVLDSGDLSSLDWYGPGKTSGLAVDANFVVPLPARLYVRGELNYTRFKTAFDGVGVITEEEGVYEAVDSNVGATVKLGVEF